MEADIRSSIDKALNHRGKIDVLVTNAAMMTLRPLLEFSIEDWDKVMAINLSPVFLRCKHCIPHMKQGDCQ